MEYPDGIKPVPCIYVVEYRGTNLNVHWQFFCLFHTKQLAQEYVGRNSNNNKEFRYGPYVVHQSIDTV